MKQENMIHNEERNYSIEIDPEMTQIIELVDKGIKRAIEKYTPCVLKK